MLAISLLMYSLLDIVSEDINCLFRPSPTGLPLEIFVEVWINTAQVSPCVWMDSYHWSASYLWFREIYFTSKNLFWLKSWLCHYLYWIASLRFSDASTTSLTAYTWVLGVSIFSLFTGIPITGVVHFYKILER